MTIIVYPEFSGDESTDIEDGDFTFPPSGIFFVRASATTESSSIGLGTPIGRNDVVLGILAVDTTFGVDVSGTGIPEETFAEGEAKYFKSNNVIWQEV